MVCSEMCGERGGEDLLPRDESRRWTGGYAGFAAQVFHE